MRHRALTSAPEPSDRSRALQAQLARVALRILKRRDFAAEVLQDAFVSVWREAGSYPAAASQPMTWLISIVRNKALDIVRSHARRRFEQLLATLRRFSARARR